MNEEISFGLTCKAFDTSSREGLRTTIYRYITQARNKIGIHDGQV